MKVENQFNTKIQRINNDENKIFSICYGFNVEDEKNNMHDFYLMCIQVFQSIMNNKLKLYNIQNIINVDDFTDDLDVMNKKINNLIIDIETDRRTYNQSGMDINDYIKMRDRKNKITKLLYGNQ